ncbi:hypothetical protein [Thermaurantiacus sp.]
MTGGADPAGLALLSLMARRMGHDLASPLGALMTALDLAGEDDPLAGLAAHALADRLSLWRGLLGPAADEPADWGVLAGGLAAEAARTKGTSLAMAGVEALPPRAAKAAAALTLQALGLLAGPGQVAATAGEDKLLIRVTGRLSVVAEALADFLAGQAAPDSQLAPAAFARALGFPIRQERMADGLILSMRFTPPG